MRKLLICQVQFSLLNVQYETFSTKANSDLFDHGFCKIMQVITYATYCTGKMMLQFMSSLIFLHTPVLLCNSIQGKVAGLFPVLAVVNSEGPHRQPDNTTTPCQLQSYMVVSNCHTFFAHEHQNHSNKYVYLVTAEKRTHIYTTFPTGNCIGK